MEQLREEVEMEVGELPVEWGERCGGNEHFKTVLRVVGVAAGRSLQYFDASRVHDRHATRPAPAQQASASQVCACEPSCVHADDHVLRRFLRARK